MLLKINNLNISFINRNQQENLVVKNFCCELKPAKICALIGQSGSGKSIIAMTILRLLNNAKISGEILFENQNLLQIDEKSLQKKSVLFFKIQIPHSIRFIKLANKLKRRLKFTIQKFLKMN